ncbi:hypothetical protein EJ05DRAFT_246905 [Pseudovirgaria hyperparasitica]|uniref:RNA polymerase II degradation factor 1 n=1 Tax=Pseudovirgaria hyperparasitica TaxID=470096 RepID=A0A6A6WH16_9PEZI|nr:uncharacterized protein EJ05DRAFT_246905 [Pseudovirgaria hyperparasitica]KAF2760937.1 hypothetical protein EJ05DRAFT_246905 [Pseudovirgaria hyperparasitica]
MSEVQSRPSGRGRSSVRGRGGFRGAPRSKHPNGDSSAVVDHTADEGELAELKKTYRAQLSTLKEMFPDWTDMDLLLGLQDSDGDLERTIDKITEENKTPPVVSEDPEPQLTPSKDELTEENVEHLPDATEQPALTETVASTIDASSVIGNATPAGQSTPAALPRPPMGGYAATALKATATPGRSASYQRRLFEQHEAVVMPGHNAVDRAAVQFGSLGLNGDADADLDVDEEREAAETRQQPPQHSPTGQPRTSLPPVPRHTSASAEQAPLEAVPTPKQAPGLPPVPQQQSPSTTLGGAPGLTQGAPGNQQYNQFSRYGQSAEATAPTQQKSYDPFGHQAPHSTPFETYPSQSQGPSQQPQPAPSGLGGYTSTPNDLTSYYTTDHQRTQYQNYYNNSYGQPGQQPATSQDAGAGQQRAGSAFGSASGEPAFPASQAQQPQSRYTDAQNSGNNTPNPVSSGQHGAQSQQTGHNLHQQHSGHGGYGGYNHPYYSQPYYQSYMNQMNQYGGGYGNQGYGPYGGGGKSGMHNQPHYGYGMSPQSSFDQHSSSPANAGGFGHSSVQGREGGLGGGFGDYGRSGSTQPSSQQHGASGFGGASEGFGRQQSGFQSQSQYGQQQQQQSGQQSGTEDSLKPFGESKSNAGPSPSLNQPGRPGSATNTSGAGNAGLPAPQSHQQGFSGGYPNHLSGQNSQYGGGLGGLGGGHQGGQGHQGQHQAHQGQGYGFGGGYGGYNNSGGYNRGGWSSNYQGH